MSSSSETLAVSEFFLSLQGEGSRAGRVCAFVRLRGCNLSCAWCDTPYTWQPQRLRAEPYETLTVAAIAARLAAMGSALVEVTGGEPLLQAATPELLATLCDAGHEVVLNTSGSLSTAAVDPRVILALDVKCPASGQSQRMEWSNLGRLKSGQDEVKFVIADRADYDWAQTVCAEHGLPERVKVIFSPVTPLDWRGDHEAWLLPAELAGWMLADRCPATLQLQLHRLVWPAAFYGRDEGA
jgi:7-carboxy-7-deazaguanine synthase